MRCERGNSRAEVCEAFWSRFGRDPEVVGFGPGRVNLVGEHTDYNDGYVFPAAIDLGTWVAAMRTGGRSELFSLESGTAEAFDTATVKPGDVRGWTRYPAGMAWAMREVSGRPVANIRAVVHGELPVGGGVSSSAALEMAFGVVWGRLSDTPLEGKELARTGQICENKFVGVNSGIMDQMASAMGREGQALFLDTRNLEITYFQMPQNLAIILCDTTKPRALTDSAYNERRMQCEVAANALQVPSLRDANLVLLESRKNEMDDVIYRRARHIITDNERCQEFAAALDRRDLASIGRLMKDCHQSLRYDYEVSCEELDAMAESAWEAPGCIGALMTGAGFGGVCVALVESDRVDHFIERTASLYLGRTGLDGKFSVTRAADGARVE